MDIELLISCVETRPCLWDKSMEDYKDKVKTNNAWREVCCEIKEGFVSLTEEDRNKFGKEVLKKWSNIRDSFRKFVKQQRETGSGSGAKAIKKYIYYDQLQFLNKIVNERNSEDSLPCGPEEEVNKQTHNPSVPETLDKSTPVTSRTVPKKKRRKLDEVDQRMLRALEEGGNPHLSFFKGLLPSLTDLSTDETIDLQLGVLQLIKSIKLKRLNQSFVYPVHGSYPHCPYQQTIPTNTSTVNATVPPPLSYNSMAPQQTYYQSPSYSSNHQQLTPAFDSTVRTPDCTPSPSSCVTSPELLDDDFS